MQKAGLMEIVLKAGEIMLTSGAEIYRVEETITRICDSYNLPCESFVLPTGVFVSFRNEDGSIQTAFKRIKQRTINLNRIDKVNTFSRSLKNKKLSYENAMAQLSGIESGKQYSLPARIAAAAVGSFVFALLFRGTYYDGIAAATIGIIVYIIREIIAGKELFQFFELFASGLVAGFLSLAAIHIYPYLNEFIIIVASVMLYLPGMAITNGIKDALYGDLIASFTRLGEAFLVAVALAAGVVISLSIGANWG